MIEYSTHTTIEEWRPPEYSLLLRVPAFFFSFILHPLFIPVIVVAWLAFVQQGYFTGIPAQNKMMIIARVAVNTVLFPAITILLLRGLGFLQSIFMRTQRERVIPYVATNIFYFWIFLVFKNQPEMPLIVTSFLLGIFLASAAALVLNSFFKISMHALGMGSFLGVMLVVIFSGLPYSIFLSLMTVILLTGIVCTSRLILSDHTFFDINSGLLIGILCQSVAFILFR